MRRSASDLGSLALVAAAVAAMLATAPRASAGDPDLRPGGNAAGGPVPAFSQNPTPNAAAPDPAILAQYMRLAKQVIQLIQKAKDMAQLNAYQQQMTDGMRDQRQLLNEAEAKYQGARSAMDRAYAESSHAENRLAATLDSDTAGRQAREKELRDATAARDAAFEVCAKAYHACLKARSAFAAYGVVANMAQQALLKRMQALDTGLAWGSWGGYYLDPDVQADPMTIGGTFKLVITGGSTVSGVYQGDGPSIPVSGTYDSASGRVEGSGSDPNFPASWSGTLVRNPATRVLSGSGAFSFNATGGKGKGSGTWTTK